MTAATRGGPGGGGPQTGRKPRALTCPACGKRVTWEGNPWRPFCSERCQVIDRAAWAEGAYAIPSEDTPSREPPEKE
ncbi:MAG: DNA gyrase inhibitor YacG [Candidatus Lambdaproteobacteria bacterium]|nr:DNA gyrase inhibitor YacG [Candidatus Lambdaproteobacteria bacterium]